MRHYGRTVSRCQLLRSRMIRHRIIALDDRKSGHPCQTARIGGKSAMPSFVYILAAQNPDGRIITYVGWTLDLERRLAEHNGAIAKVSRGAKSTRGRNWML